MPSDSSNLAAAVRAEATKMEAQSKKGDQAFSALVTLILIGVVGIACYASCPDSCAKWYCNFSIGMLVAGASLLFGGFFGFLFGFPRAVARTNGTTGQTGAAGEALKEKPPNTEPNTNLEQISDWLTKILVGAGLTQLNKIPRKLGELSNYIGLGMSNTGADRAFITAVIIFYGICGFLIAFLWARIYMAALLAPPQAEELRQGIQENTKQIQDSAKQDQLLEAKSALRAALNSNNPPTSQLFKSTAQEALKKGYGIRPEFLTDRALGILMARAEQELNGYDAALRLLTQIISDFKREKKDDGPDFAALLYNRACYKNLLAQEILAPAAANADALAKAEKARVDAWEDLKTCCKIDPTNKEEAQNDPDLQALPNGKDRTWATL